MKTGDRREATKVGHPLPVYSVYLVYQSGALYPVEEGDNWNDGLATRWESKNASIVDSILPF